MASTSMLKPIDLLETRPKEDVTMDQDLKRFGVAGRPPPDPRNISDDPPYWECYTWNVGTSVESFLVTICCRHLLHHFEFQP